MKFVVAIPARLKSTRLPGKPLIDILGKSMIQRTYEQCIKAVNRELVYVVTDSDVIKKHCEDRDMQVVMTSEKCLTGTDRIAEFSDHIDADYYINVQGDEPLINPDDIQLIINAIDSYPDEILNGYAPIDSEDDYRSFSVPKLVFRQDKKLMYMSRAAIPANKSNQFVMAYRQVCIYSFPKKSLKAFRSNNGKASVEGIEDIEILRFIELGYEVRMIEVSPNSISVDHATDVEKVINKLANG